AAKDEDDALLRGAETHFNAVRNPALLSPGPGEAEAERQFELLAIHAQNQTLQAELEPSRRDTHVAELEALRTELYKNLDALTTENTRLVAMLRDIERSTPYRALTALKRLLPSGR